MRNGSILQDRRSDGLAARGFANFLVHWHAGFKAAWEVGIPYALDPERVGYIHDRAGFCPSKDCSSYVDLFRLGLLNRTVDIIGPEDDQTQAGRRVDLPDRLPKGQQNWAQVLQA